MMAHEITVDKNPPFGILGRALVVHAGPTISRPIRRAIPAPGTHAA
jgi:hypothetical protein